MYITYLENLFFFINISYWYYLCLIKGVEDGHVLRVNVGSSEEVYITLKVSIRQTIAVISVSLHIL